MATAVPGNSVAWILVLLQGYGLSVHLLEAPSTPVPCSQRSGPSLSAVAWENWLSSPHPQALHERRALVPSIAGLACCPDLLTSPREPTHLKPCLTAQRGDGVVAPLWKSSLLQFLELPVLGKCGHWGCPA